MTSTDGVYIDERLVRRVDASGPSPRRWCCRTRGSTWRCSRWRGGILQGLGYGRNVGVVLNVTGDHLGLREVNTLEQLSAVKQVVVEARSGPS